MPLRLFVIFIVSIAMTGCATDGQSSKKLQGAGWGALAGAVVGVATGDDADERRKRALIGAGVGALTGTAIGAYMDKQEALLREQLATTDVSVQRVGDDLILNMPSAITFDTNQHNLKGEIEPVLESVSATLLEYDKTLIDVVGYTDSTGPLDFNFELSQRRAMSVAEILLQNGLNSTRVQTSGAGPQNPVADNQTIEGRAANRRVELILKPLT